MKVRMIQHVMHHQPGEVIEVDEVFGENLLIPNANGAKAEQVHEDTELGLPEENGQGEKSEGAPVVNKVTTPPDPEFEAHLARIRDFDKLKTSPPVLEESHKPQSEQMPDGTKVDETAGDHSEASKESEEDVGDEAQPEEDKEDVEEEKVPAPTQSRRRRN